MKNELVVVTGAGGFIGGALVAEFRRQGRRIRAIVEDIAGIRLNRRYDLDAPKGVMGRNSDNTRIQRYLHWEPDIPLRTGMEKTYAWIYDQFLASEHAKPAEAVRR